jgi:hypothetical protein
MTRDDWLFDNPPIIACPLASCPLLPVLLKGASWGLSNWSGFSSFDAAVHSVNLSIATAVCCKDALVLCN